MSDDNQQDDLFGEPPLIKGEDSARYYRLFAEIKHEIKPETVFDKIRVRELADKLWQQQRCKRKERGRDRDTRKAVTRVYQRADRGTHRESTKHRAPDPSEDLAGVFKAEDREAPGLSARDDEAFADAEQRAPKQQNEHRHRRSGDEA